MESAPNTEITAALVGVAELAREIGMSRCYVWYKLSKAKTISRGKLPPIGPRGKWRTAFDRNEAIAALNRGSARQKYLIGVEELASITGLSYQVVRSRIKAAGLVSAGSIPPPFGKKNYCYGYNKAAALDAIRSVAGAPCAAVPAALAVVDAIWIPAASKAVQDMSAASPLSAKCPFAGVPCRLSASCSAHDLIHDVRGPGRQAAAELCLNYTVPPTSGRSGAQTCKRCGLYGRAACAFDCFRVAHGKFIVSAFGCGRNRRPATKKDDPPCAI